MKIGVALSGGGIRGIAHAGVLKALKENNIKVDIIGGTSAGGMVASLYAMGFEPEQIHELFKKYAKEIIGTKHLPLISKLLHFSFSKKITLTGFNNGEAIEKIYDKVAKEQGIEKISQIQMPLVIPTVDIMNPKEYIFTNNIPINAEDKSKYIKDITAGKAVRASSSFPAVFMPCRIKDYAFMDGGVLDNVPVQEVRNQGAERVLAVKFDADQIEKDSNIMDIAMKTIDIMGSKISEEGLKTSDYILNVYTDKVGLLDIEKLDKCYEYGYQSVIKNLDAIKKALG